MSLVIPVHRGNNLLFVAQHIVEELQTSNGVIEGEMMSVAIVDWFGQMDLTMKLFLKNKQEGKPWIECHAHNHQAYIYMKIIPVTCQ